MGSHGSHTGVNRHNRNGEPLCDECREFRRVYAAQRRAANAAVRDNDRTHQRRQAWAVGVLKRRHQAEYAELLELARDKVG